MLLLEESGGVVTDMYGAKLDFGHGPRLEKNRGVMASCNPDLHQRMVEAVKKHADV